VVVPLKAALLNLLSIGAAYGGGWSSSRRSKLWGNANWWMPRRLLSPG
jgi:hypothetical protein